MTLFGVTQFGVTLFGVTLLGVLAGGCHRGPVVKQAEPIRLVDHLDGAEVRWRGVAGGPPTKLKAAKVGGAPEGGRLVRVMMSDTDGRSASKRWSFDDRLALLAPTGTRYRFSVKLPEKPLLQLGLGFVTTGRGGDSVPSGGSKGGDSVPSGRSRGGDSMGDPARAPSQVRFEVTIEAVSDLSPSGVGDSEVVLDEVMRVEEEGRWRDRELPLERWAGQAVVIQLATHGVAEQPRVWAAWGTPEVISGQGRQDGWDLILISLDTLRADHLGCYGYTRPTSPWIDSLAERGVRFATAVSQSPWTKPSHQSLFNGLFPHARQGLTSPPLATVLWQAGYRTLAITGGGQVHPRFGFNAGFETYRVEDWVRSPDLVVESLDRGRGRKQFLFLHTYEIHDPYFHTTFTEGLSSGWVSHHFSKRNKDPLRLGRHPSEVELDFVKALYDGGIAFVDQKLGQIFKQLESRGVFERAIVVLTSDHGEQFWEHGRWGHGTNVYDHQLLVPLVIYLPPALRRELSGDLGASPGVVAQQVRLIDLYPTLLDLLDVPLSHRVQGRSLRALLAGGTMREVDAFAEDTNFGIEAKALRTSRIKFVYGYQKRNRSSTVRKELYDLLQDPGEHRNLVKERPELVEALFQRMQAIIHGSDAAEDGSEVPGDLDPKLREQLEALGYLGN